MKPYQLAIIAICAVCTASAASDIVTVQNARPLSALALELQNRYGYPVTYEEAPPDSKALQTQQLVNGRTFSSIPATSVTFQVPSVAVGATMSGLANRVPAGLPDIVPSLLAQYSRATNSDPNIFQPFLKRGTRTLSRYAKL
jgi:hypothetical protein